MNMNYELFKFRPSLPLSLKDDFRILNKFNKEMLRNCGYPNAY